VNPAKISQISEWPISRSTIEVWDFLGLVRYLATFISHLVEHTIVFDGLVWKKLDKAFLKWLERHQKVFKTIKKIITGAKYLTTIDYNSGEIIIYKPNRNKSHIEYGAHLEKSLSSSLWLLQIYSSSEKLSYLWIRNTHDCQGI